MAAAPLPDEPGVQPYYELAGEPIRADYCFNAPGADEPVRFSARMALVVAPSSSHHYTYFPDHAWSAVYPCGG